MLTDAHAHIYDKGIINILRKFNMYTTACAMSPEECKFVESLYLEEKERVIPTYGIHPWNAAKYKVEDILPYLEKCPAIGEIGMDNVWCEVPLDIQRSVFIEQLDIASRRGVPAILHTKGQELEISQIIDNYPKLTFLIHWFSSIEHLDKYLNKGYYFSIGPDIEKEESVQNVAKAVPLDRIVIETDGVEGISWGVGKPATLEDTPSSLKHTLSVVAKLRNISEEILQTHVNENFHRLFRPIH